MFIYVATGIGTLSFPFSDAAFTSGDVVKEWRRSLPSASSQNHHMQLYLDANCSKPLNPQKPVVSQGITYGSTLYGLIVTEVDNDTTGREQEQRERTSSTHANPTTTTTAKRPPPEPNAMICSNNNQENHDNHRVKRRRRTIGERFHWPVPFDDEPLDDFLRDTLPSQTSRCDCHWIDVCNPRRQASTGCLFDTAPYQEILKPIEKMIANKERIKADVKKKAVNEILGLAAQRGETTGKWMLFEPPSRVDRTWTAIARATVQGELGPAAKVAPCKDSQGGVVVICVYVADFSDTKDVKRVLKGIGQLGFNVTCGFKPDIFTILGIYAKNKWKLEPTIYKPKELLAEDDGFGGGSG